MKALIWLSLFVVSTTSFAATSRSSLVCTAENLGTLNCGPMECHGPGTGTSIQKSVALDQPTADFPMTSGNLTFSFATQSGVAYKIVASNFGGYAPAFEGRPAVINTGLELSIINTATGDEVITSTTNLAAPVSLTLMPKGVDMDDHITVTCQLK